MMSADIVNGTAFELMDMEALDLHSSINTTTSINNDTTIGEFGLLDIEPLDIGHLAVRSAYSAAAIIGNSLTLIALRKYPNLQVTTNLLIGNLACWDLFSGFIIGVNIALAFLGGTDYYTMLCLFKPMLNVIFPAGIAHAMLFLALDKLFMIMFPLRYMRGPSVKTMTAFLFVYNTCLIGLHACLFAVGRKASPYSICSVFEIIGKLYFQVIIPEWLLVTLVMLVAYCRILVFVYKRCQPSTNAQLGIHNTSAAEERQLAATKLVCLIMGIYLVGYLPTLVLLPFHAASWQKYALTISNWILFASFWLNPILYAWKCNSFRQAFYKILTLKD